MRLKELVLDLKELAEIDYYEAKEKLPQIEDELKMLLIPKGLFCDFSKERPFVPVITS